MTLGLCVMLHLLGQAIVLSKVFLTVHKDIKLATHVDIYSSVVWHFLKWPDET